jgi:small-conductance mechanosensitive channel
VAFNEFAADHLNIRVYYWFYVPPGETGYFEFLAHRDLVNRRLLVAFADNDLDFAFPTQTVRLMNEDNDSLLITSSREEESPADRSGKRRTATAD